MTLWLTLSGTVIALGLVWWLQRWHQRQAEYLPENWIHRRAQKAWRK